MLRCGMPEFRKDPITERWVIISTGRDKRPSDFLTSINENTDVISPFTPGNEAMTPPEVYALRENGSQPDTPGWSIRVVPNRFPVLELAEKNTVNPATPEGFLMHMPGIGAHEVVIETDQPDTHLAAMKVEAIVDILKVYQLRLKSLTRDARWVYAIIFKNNGMKAGATLRHPHSQILALPFLPPAVAGELDRARNYHRQHQKGITCQLIEQELNTGTRVIDDGKNIVALSPYAARFAYETWLLPKQHASAFDTLNTKALQELATLLKGVIMRLDRILDCPAYNLIVHTAPLQAETLDHFHWRIEILPRLTQLAGFEQGSGIFINTVSPEAATITMKKTVDLLQNEECE